MKSRMHAEVIFADDWRHLARFAWITGQSLEHGIIFMPTDFCRQTVCLVTERAAQLDSCCDQDLPWKSAASQRNLSESA
jgi:hypothetical protein